METCSRSQSTIGGKLTKYLEHKRDRTDIPYQNLKQAIYENRIQIPQSKLLQRELRELQYSRKNGRGKIDHPDATSADTLTYGKGSKDCFTGDTEVLVLDYNKTLHSISIEDLIDNFEEYTLVNYDMNGNFKECELVDVFENGIVDELIEIEMEDGYIVRCTPDHRFLTTDGWVEAQNLTEDMELININN